MWIANDMDGCILFKVLISVHLNSLTSESE